MVVLLESSREVKGWGVLVGDDDMGKVDSGSFSEGWESFFDSDEGGGVIKVLVH